MKAQEKEKCSHCGATISKRKIKVSQEMVKALAKVYKWCDEKGRHEFKTNEVRHLFTHVQYATFGDWVYFGGMVYKEGKANYGLNMDRCKRFLFQGARMYASGWKDPVTKEFTKDEGDIMTVREIPELQAFLDEEGMYQVEYAPASIQP